MVTAGLTQSGGVMSVVRYVVVLLLALSAVVVTGQRGFVRRRPFPARKRSDLLAAESLQSSLQENSLPAFAEFQSSAFIQPEQLQLQKNIKTYIVTKKVPVPYPVQYETRVPLPVKVPIRRPYAVYVPKPYYVQVPKPVPYAIKVPVPHPFKIEQQVPFPFKIPYDKPIPFQIPKPYPVYVEKKVPVYVEKNVPVAFEKPVPVPVKIPVEPPVPVQIEIEKPVSIPVEKQVIYQVNHPQLATVENPISLPVEGTTTYEVKLKDSEQNASPTHSREYLTPIKSNNFSPSPYDFLTSSLIANGKQQKVISFTPNGHQNSDVIPEQSISSNLFDKSSSWSPINASNDWVPRFVSPSPNHHRQGLKSVSQSAHDVRDNQALRNEVYPTHPSQIYFTSEQTTAKPTAQTYQDGHLYDQSQLDVKKNYGPGNYQFFNVHSVEGAKTGSQVSGVSYQRYQTEVRPTEALPTPEAWLQVQPGQPQREQFQQEGDFGKKENVGQQSTASSLSQQTNHEFNPHNFHQYKVFYQGPNEDHFQVKQHLIIPSTYKPDHYTNLVPHEQNQVENSHVELTQDQFSNQNFPQLQQSQQPVGASQAQQQYQQQAASSSHYQPQTEQQQQQAGAYDSAATDFAAQHESQYLQQLVGTAVQTNPNQFHVQEDPGSSAVGEQLQQTSPRHYSQRRRQTQRSRLATPGDSAQPDRSSFSPDPTSSTTTTEAAPRTRKTRRRSRRRNMTILVPDLPTSPAA